jgi:NMD protein affecting ribosome stability and mRNA decay
VEFRFLATSMETSSGGKPACEWAARMAHEEGLNGLRCSLCCLCGVRIPPNPANMCVACLRSQVDITESVPRSLTVSQCRNCMRWNRPPYMHAELESPELLSLLLKKIPSLGRSGGPRLVDANFVWTEPHSKRIKVKLTLQQDTEYRVRLQQSMVVEFTVVNQQCTDCQRSFTEHTWKSAVQVRQDVPHKKTFFFLEQLILRHNAHVHTSNIESKPKGIDFFFGEKSHAAKFLDFLGSCVPVRFKTSKKLVGADLKSYVYNFKYSYFVEIAPVCRDDLVLIPPRTAANLGSISPLCLVYRVSNVVFLVDPTTLQTAELSSDRYWREPFRALLSAPSLSEFTVLDVTPTAVVASGEAAAVFSHVSTPMKKNRARKRRGRKAKEDLHEDDDDDENPASVFGRRAGSSVISGKSGSLGMGAISASHAGGRARVSRSVRSGMGGGDAIGPGGRRRVSADDDEAGSMVTSAKDTSRSVGVGQGGMGGVTMGKRIFGGGTSVTTSVTGGPKGKFLLADVELIRTRDLGVKDARIVVRTHLGNVLKPGDVVQGYDLANAPMAKDAILAGGNVEGTGDAAESAVASAGGKKKGKKSKGAGLTNTGRSRVFKGAVPDVILVRKVYPERVRSKGARGWKLRKLPMQEGGTEEGIAPPTGSRAAAEAERREKEYEEFLDDLEHDRDMRRRIRLYRDAGTVAGEDSAKGGPSKSADEIAELAALAARGEGGDESDDGDSVTGHRPGIDDEELLDEGQEEADEAELARLRAERLAAEVAHEGDANGEEADGEEVEGEWMSSVPGVSAEMDVVDEEEDEDEEEDLA